jgi:4-amino-4-deoxy-L-arabinose transferase-like glycosyltransferase
VPDRRFVSWLAGITAMGLAVRVAVLVTSHWGDGFSFNDGPYYSKQAFDLADGVLFRDVARDAPGAEHGPLTPILLAPFSLTDSVDLQRIGTIVFGLVTIVVIGLVGRRLGGDRVGLAAAAVAALYPNLWLNDGIVMAETAGALCVSLWLLAGLRWRERGDLASAAAWGAVGALGALARSELALLAVIALVVVLGARRWRVALALGATAALVVAPWVGWNLTRFDRPVLLSTNDGTTLRGANCDETYRGDAIGSWVLDCLIASDPETVTLETSRRAAAWRSEAFEYAGDHLDRVPVVLAARTGRLLDVYGVGWMVDEDVRDDRPRWGSWAGVVSWWLLAPIAAYGVVRLARRGDRTLLVAPVVTVVVTTLLFYGGHRIRSPLEPVVALGAALVLGGIDVPWPRRSSPEPTVPPS